MPFSPGVPRRARRGAGSPAGGLKTDKCMLYVSHGKDTAGEDARAGFRIRAGPAAGRPAADGAGKCRRRSASGRCRPRGRTWSGWWSRPPGRRSRPRAAAYRLPGRTGDAPVTDPAGAAPGPRAGRRALDEAVEDPDGYLRVDARGAASTNSSRSGCGARAWLAPASFRATPSSSAGRPTARTGDIVVALVDHDATVKTFVSRGDGRVTLRPRESGVRIPIELDCRGGRHPRQGDREVRRTL